MSVSHARLRNNCSNLNNDHLRERSFCSWCNVIEDAKHYFFTCNHYRNERLIFFEAVRGFQPLNIKLLLLGNDTLNNTSNVTLFRAVHEYIKNTKIFDTERACMSPSKLVCLMLFIPMALSLVIPLVTPEVFCLSMWSGGLDRLVNVEKSIQPLFISYFYDI